ncbi:universal stress protein (plasmid) [Pseudorhodobacter turbinis]|uniref:Universal stress protein n=1 Tax=Pseudorhodobacter turbinis TaxID=2500533 RepID=A0A4P8EIR0_9RHOB|nr:universal stress protein [Pseudorhodobacter turbinis]QCO56722.1 universal stress protein [Pseudorhodobacter turbinis]
MKIIALVDGSAYARSVCELAGWTAVRLEARVEALHVLGRREAGEQDLSGAIRLGARTALLEELAELDAARSKLITQKGRAILEDAKAVLAAAGVAEVSTRMRHGDLLEEMGSDSDLIVVGKRGEAADFAKGHLGSNLERIVRGAKVPVLVAARAFAPVARVLVAFDGGPSARRAVDYIAGSPLFSGAEVVVVSVGEGTAAGLEDAKTQLTAAGLNVEVRQLPGQPEKVLSKMVEEEGFGMLVMGAYGHSRIRSLIIGSTTTEMIRSCKVPVMLLR